MEKNFILLLEDANIEYLINSYSKKLSESELSDIVKMVVSSVSVYCLLASLGREIDRLVKFLKRKIRIMRSITWIEWAMVTPMVSGQR